MNDTQKNTKKNTEKHKYLCEFVFSFVSICVKVLTCLSVLFSVMLPSVTEGKAVSLYLSPDSGEYPVGSVISVKVRVDSQGMTINAAQAKILFPQELLEVEKVSKTDSIFKLWPEEPFFSNPKGEISFKGGVPAPGFVGKGTIVSVSFKAKKIGTAQISLKDAAVLAADGKGTDILGAVRGATFSIVEPVLEIIPEVPPEIPPKVPPKVPPELPKVEKVPVDITPPEPFEIVIDNQGDLTNPRPLLYFETKDDLSGMSHYELQIDAEEIISIPVSKTKPFQLPFQTPGSHNIVVRAIDQAGNFRESSSLFNVESIPVPEIYVYPKTYMPGKEVFYVEGGALPNITVILLFKKDGELIKTWEVTSDSKGNWSFSTEEFFEPGNFLLSAQGRDQRGTQSQPSPEYQVRVMRAAISVVPCIFTYQILFLIVLVLILLLAGIIICLVFLKVKKAKEETKEAKKSLKKAFDALKKEISKKIEYLDSKPGLSAKERKIRDELMLILEKSEKTVTKEIQDIEKELK